MKFGEYFKLKYDVTWIPMILFRHKMEQITERLKTYDILLNPEHSDYSTSLSTFRFPM